MFGADRAVEQSREDALVVIKSTVPVGTNSKTFARLNELTGRTCDVASNPEFLKEGAAIDDFTKPDRVVVGVDEEQASDVLHELYKPFLRTEKPFIAMGIESAEMVKYAANCMLATKISFMNEMSNIAERLGADIEAVAVELGLNALDEIEPFARSVQEKGGVGNEIQAVLQ